MGVLLMLQQVLRPIHVLLSEIQVSKTAAGENVKIQVIVLDEKSCSWKDFSLILVFIMNDFTCYFCVFQLERFCLMATSRASLGLIPFCTSISAFQIIIKVDSQQEHHDNNFNLCNCCLWPMRSMFSFSTAIMSPERPRGSTQSMLNRVGRLRRGTCRG